jgi:hypothetical protein
MTRRVSTAFPRGAWEREGIMKEMTQKAQEILDALQ